MSMIGFASAQAAYENAEPDDSEACDACTDEDCGTCDGVCCDDCTSPPCGGCSPQYARACDHCSDYDG